MLERFIWKLFKVIRSRKGIAKRVYLSRVSNYRLATEANIKYCFYIQQTKTGVLRVNRMQKEDFAIIVAEDTDSDIKNLLQVLLSNNKDIV